MTAMITRAGIVTAALALALGSAVVSPQSTLTIIGHDPEAPGHPGFVVTPPASPFLMAFHTCVAGVNCEDPASHLIRLAQSEDGADWQDVAGWKPYRGSVPDVARRGNTIYVIGAGVSKVDIASGQVTAHRIRVTKADGSPAMPRDAAFAGQLPDGRFVLTYVPPMQDVSPGSSVPVLLAHEVAGSDVTEFVTTGEAITVSPSVAGTVGMATDPDIFFNGERWVLYVSVGSNVIAFTSPVLEGPYDLSSSTVVSTQAGGVPAGILGTDGVWTYVNRGPTRDNISILRAVSATGSEPIPSGSFTTVLTGSRYGAGTAESPGVAANAPGIPCGSGCASDRPLPRPGRVSALKVSGLKRTSATVTWRPPTSGSGADLSAYELRTRSSGGRWTSWVSQRATELSRRYAGLRSKTRYVLQVRAVGAAGPGPAVTTTFVTR